MSYEKGIRFLGGRGIVFSFPKSVIYRADAHGCMQSNNSEVRVTALTEAGETVKVCELISVLTNCNLV